MDDDFIKSLLRERRDTRSVTAPSPKKPYQIIYIFSIAIIQIHRRHFLPPLSSSLSTMSSYVPIPCSSSSARSGGETRCTQRSMKELAQCNTKMTRRKASPAGSAAPGSIWMWRLLQGLRMIWDWSELWNVPLTGFLAHFMIKLKRHGRPAQNE
jgi:hypothetical protein